MLKLKYPPFLKSIRFKKILIFTLFFWGGTSSYLAQYTEIINANQPGFSESPYSVGTGIYQFENNFFLRNLRLKSNSPRTQSGGAHVQFRTSFLLEKLELNAHFNYHHDRVALGKIYTTGFSSMIINAKYLVYEQTYEDKTKEIRSWKKRGAFDKKRLIPSVGISLGMNANFSNKINDSTSISPKMGLLLQHNLTPNFNIINNFYFNNIGSKFSEFSHIVTATQNFYNRYSIFFENKTVFQKNQKNINLGLGLAYLYHKNLQINTSGRFLFEGKAQGFYASVGFSYRIDRHQDRYKDLDSNGVEIKKDDTSNEKQLGFFKRFLGIFKNKNKDKKAQEKKNPKKKKNNFFNIFRKNKKESEVEKLEREIKELEKEMKEDEKKKSKKKKNKFLGIFGKKKKESEVEKLEREIKELEKEMKKEEKKKRKAERQKRNN